uniref:Angiopoietin-related protein 3-like n=2 Tax=Takifugu rubripes TaxID=31033 RepID=A0A674MQU5_TAKRU
MKQLPGGFMQGRKLCITQPENLNAKMKIAHVLLLVLLSAGVPALCEPKEQPGVQPVAPTQAPRSRFAALDDVRLLGNGLLQLGQSLREFVQKTKGQINDIFQKLSIFDRSFNQLSVLTSEIKEEEEELKKTTVVLKASNDEIKGLSVQIVSKVDSILQEKSSLHDKLEGLEEKLSSLSNGLVPRQQAAEISSLREVIHSQETSIRELLRAVTDQSDQLNLQRMKIKTLEEKLSRKPQETIEKIPEVFSSEMPMLSAHQPPHLTSTSELMRDLPSDCSQLFDRGARVSSVYSIQPHGSEPFMVFCDMSKGHGETVIQRRMDGLINFDQTWETYENGFGALQEEFWLGLRNIRSLLVRGNSVLHVQLEDWKQGRHSSEYTFYLHGPEEDYAIDLRLLSGDLPDPMGNLTGMAFSTKDRDSDQQRDSDCAHGYTGGWWFNACGDAFLNGKYFQMRPKGRTERRKGIQWRSGPKAFTSLMSTQISVRQMAPPSSVSSTSSQTEVFH